MQMNDTDVFWHSLDAEMATAVDEVHTSLVQLTNGRRGGGAGTIWHSDGLILTNAHVVRRRAPRVTLWDGRDFPSRLLALDEKRDLAALRIDAHNLPTIKPGDSRRLAAGTWVLAVGHPWGVVGAVSAGTIIAVGRPLEWPNFPGELIQTSLWLRPGHSGGPLVDGNGRLLGINTMISGPQVGLAIPFHIVKAFLKENLSRARAST